MSGLKLIEKPIEYIEQIPLYYATQPPGLLWEEDDEVYDWSAIANEITDSIAEVLGIKVTIKIEEQQ
tara:strand:+ start:9939 stop:10139 length:201 start_codon:yes stop_codon:yes gene_type:complete